jgi:maleylacetate reductase
VLPRAVVYDPELTRSLPVGISVASALNAVAHAVEALYAPDGSPVIALMAEEGIRALGCAIGAVAGRAR